MGSYSITSTGSADAFPQCTDGASLTTPYAGTGANKYPQQNQAAFGNDIGVQKYLASGLSVAQACLTFDTSGIPSGETVTAATLTVTSYRNSDRVNPKATTLEVYGHSYPVSGATFAQLFKSATALAAATQLATGYSVGATVGSWPATGGSVTITLNASGLAAINKGAGALTQLLLAIGLDRLATDVSSWAVNDTTCTSIYPGSFATAGSRPTLAVTTTAAPVAVGLTLVAPTVDRVLVGLTSVAPSLDRATVGLARAAQWTDEVAAGLTRVARWDDAAAITAVGLARAVQWVDRVPVGLAVAAPSVDRADVGLTLAARFTARALAGQLVAAPSLDRALVGLTRVAPSADRAIVGRTVEARSGIAGTVGLTVEARWDDDVLSGAVGATRTARFTARALVGRTLEGRWAERAAVAPLTIQARWTDRARVGRTTVARWAEQALGDLWTPPPNTRSHDVLVVRAERRDAAVRAEPRRLAARPADPPGGSTVPTMPSKDPAARLDYAVDWTAWLAADGDSIETAEWSVPADLALDAETVADGVCTAWLSGGTAGRRYAVTCLIHTAYGRTDARTLTVPVAQR